MRITTVNVSEVTAAVVAMLKDSPAVHDLAPQIERGEAINEDPSKCPWIGVYRSGVPYQARALGMGSGYRTQRINLVVLCQQTDATSGEKCEDRLEELVQAVTSTLLSDPSLKGTVQTLDEFDVTYPDYRKIGTGYMQTAAVQLVGLVPVSGG